MSDEDEALIDKLEHNLGVLAMQWRSLYLKEKENEEAIIIEEYHVTFAKLWALGWDGGDLLPDSELPDELMPKYYLDKWRRK